MATETIEAVWKGGKIIPLEEVEVEDNTHVFIIFPAKDENRSTTHSLAGVWKGYRTKDKKTLDDVKKEIYDSRTISTRKEVAF